MRKKGDKDRQVPSEADKILTVDQNRKPISLKRSQRKGQLESEKAPPLFSKQLEN